MIACSVFPGLILVFFGVLLLLENLGVSDGLVGRYWPVSLIILGVASLYNIFRLRRNILNRPKGR
jgi:uncharacterized membrane protein